MIIDNASIRTNLKFFFLLLLPTRIFVSNISQRVDDDDGRPSNKSVNDWQLYFEVQ